MDGVRDVPRILLQCICEELEDDRLPNACMVGRCIFLKSATEPDRVGRFAGSDR